MKHFSELSAMAEKLVDVAEGLIEQHGYKGFSFDDLAREVGIKKPSVHHHFPTKAELATVVAQRYSHRFHTQLIAIEGKGANPKARLLAYANLFEQTYEKNRRLCVCGMLGAEINDLSVETTIEVRKFFELNLDWLTAIFSDALTKHALRLSASPEAHARAYLAALEGAMIVGRGMTLNKQPILIAQILLDSWSVA